MKTNFPKENLALSRAFIMGLKTTRKWPIEVHQMRNFPTFQAKKIRLFEIMCMSNWCLKLKGTVSLIFSMPLNSKKKHLYQWKC